MVGSIHTSHPEGESEPNQQDLPCAGRHGQMGTMYRGWTGIVGLATALEVTRRGHSVTVLEKESQPRSTSDREQLRRHSLRALLQTCGSLKANMGMAGATSMRRFAEDNGVFVDICGNAEAATEMLLPSASTSGA